MTITIGLWVIPVVVNVVWILYMIKSAMDDHSWFGGFIESILSVIGTLLIWLIFFAVMYFCK